MFGLNKAAVAQAWNEQSSTQKERLGQMACEEDRLFIYSKATEALSLGHIVVNLDPNGHATYSMDDVATNTSAEGEYAISQVITATAGADITKGALAGMPCFVDDGLGEGQFARIRTNEAVASGSTFKIYLESALTTALTAAGNSDITIYPEHLVEKAAITSSLQVPVGVAPIAVTLNYYFWRQVTGICPVLLGEAGTQWLAFTAGDNTEGEGLEIDAGDTMDLASIGGHIMIVAPAADELAVCRINML